MRSFQWLLLLGLCLSGPAWGVPGAEPEKTEPPPAADITIAEPPLFDDQAYTLHGAIRVEENASPQVIRSAVERIVGEADLGPRHKTFAESAQKILEVLDHPKKGPAYNHFISQLRSEYWSPIKGNWADLLKLVRKVFKTFEAELDQKDAIQLSKEISVFLDKAQYDHDRAGKKGSAYNLYETKPVRRTGTLRNMTPQVAAAAGEVPPNRGVFHTVFGRGPVEFLQGTATSCAGFLLAGTIAWGSIQAVGHWKAEPGHPNPPEVKQGVAKEFIETETGTAESPDPLVPLKKSEVDQGLKNLGD